MYPWGGTMRSTFLFAACFVLTQASVASAQPLSGTKPLEIKGDLARHMLDGIDKYLDRAGKDAQAKRKDYWHPNFESTEAYQKSVQPNRDRLKKILGVVDQRVPFKDLEYIATTGQGSLVAENEQYKVHSVRWPVLPGLHGEGL